jgi:uncharacterized linocin/CFP29 family protein
MGHLLREFAPISEAGWSAIEDEVKRALESFLAARRLVDYVGPKGWDFSAVDLGGVTAAEQDAGGEVSVSLRYVVPLAELRRPFSVSRVELDAIDRGSRSADLGPAVDAARDIALAEDRAVFSGLGPTDVQGIIGASPHAPVPVDESGYPGAVARAVATLRVAGVDGPYGIALGTDCYTKVFEATNAGGYPVLEHVRLVAGGPVVWAPAISGAVVVGMRGGDFELIVGQDLSIGYLRHSEEEVVLYLEETMTFAVHGPEAAVEIRP